jgi:hypothetical protein
MLGFLTICRTIERSQRSETPRVSRILINVIPPMAAIAMTYTAIRPGRLMLISQAAINGAVPPKIAAHTA